MSLCERLGLPGKPRDWNRRLFNLRKASRLSGLPRPRKTEISASDMDRCEFACEIAIQEFAENGCAPDNLLCDPHKADEFHQRVRSMVKVHLSSLLIRWAALRIRKRAKDIRSKCATVASPIGRPRTTHLAHDFDLQGVSEGPGLYWLQSADEQRKLYVGKTENLRQRFRLQIQDSPFDFWGTPRRELEIRFAPAEPAILLGNQSYWIGKWQPAEEKTFSLVKEAPIEIAAGKFGKLTDLEKDRTITLWLSLDQKAVVSVSTVKKVTK